MREDGQRTGFVLGKTPGHERIILWDDFEDLKKWGSVPGYFAPQSIQTGAWAYDGSKALRFIHYRDIPNAMWNVYGGRSVFMVPHGRFRYEALFKTEVAFDVQAFGLFLHVWDGTYLRKCGFRWGGSVSWFMYWHERNRWGSSGMPYKLLVDGAWHHLWMVVDFVKSEYVEVGCNGRTYDMTGVKMYKGAGSGGVAAYAMLHLGQMATGFVILNFDNVLLRAV